MNPLKVSSVSNSRFAQRYRQLGRGVYVLVFSLKALVPIGE